MKAIESKICYNSYTIQKSSIKWIVKVEKPCDNCKHCFKEYNFKLNVILKIHFIVKFKNPKSCFRVKALHHIKI